MKKRGQFSFFTVYVVAFGVILLLTNVILGLVMMRQSAHIVQSVVRQNMLNISNTAAGLIDGDALGSLTEEDVGSPAFNEIMRQLTVFQNNVDIEYIYAVREDGKDHYIFTVDPDPEEPAAFGDEVLVTKALLSAGDGTACVDSAPAEDQWGNFYSSYSPVYDSSGKIAGIIGVDFNSEWYEMQISQHTKTMGIITLISLFIGSVIVLVITNRLRRRFHALGDEIAQLSSDMDKLTSELTSPRGFHLLPEVGFPEGKGHGKADHPGDPVSTPGMAAAGLPEGEEDAADEIEELGRKIHLMDTELQHFLEYARVKAYKDSLTGVGNSAAYQERRDALDGNLRNAGMSFRLVMVDLNDLKQINDRFGHASGDSAIRAAAGCLANVFGGDNLYRIGGDEFLAVLEGTTDTDVQELLRLTEQEIARFNAHNEGATWRISVSMGTASFEQGQDRSFQEVFVRADDEMYRKKAEYHRRSI